MRRLLLMAAVGALLAAGPAKADADTIAELRSACRSNEGPYKLKCYAYVTGVFDMTQITWALYDKGDKSPLGEAAVCYHNANLSTAAIVQIFLNWTDSNPKEWQHSAVFGVLASLKEQYPCD